MAPAREMKEFAPEELAEAQAFIESFPADVRVYVDELIGTEWRFVFGDDRDNALSGLSRITPGARFRIRPAFLS